MQLITNKISTGKPVRFEDFVKNFRASQVKTASVKTAEEQDEAESSGQLKVEPLHQTGESTTMPKNGPSAKKDDGEKEAATDTDSEKEGKDSGQPKAEGSEQFTNNPEVPSKEEKGGSVKMESKKAGKTERGKRDGTGPFEGSAQREKSDVGKRQQKGKECPYDEDENEDEDKDVKEAGSLPDALKKHMFKKKEKTKPATDGDDDDDVDVEASSKDEDKKEKEKEASKDPKFVKWANLDSKNKSFLTTYWRQLFGDDYVNALVSDK